jgi:hypothetical protein
MSAPVILRQLPVRLVVKRAYAYVWESRRLLLPPFALFVLVSLFADLALDMVGAPTENVLKYLVAAGEEVFAMAFAVGVHRFVLLGEAPAGVRFFRWDRHFLQYVLTALALILAGFLALVIAASIAKGLGGGAVASLFLAAAAVLIAAAACRVSLALPSAALGDMIPTRLIWQATRGNGARLLAVTLLAFAPFLGVQFLLIGAMQPGGAFLTGGAVAGLGGIAATVAVALISPLQLLVLTAALALEYDFLVRGRGPAAGGASVPT